MHLETLEGEQPPLGTVHRSLTGRHEALNAAMVTLGISRHAGGRTAGPCTVHQPSWGPPDLGGMVCHTSDTLT